MLKKSVPFTLYVQERRWHPTQRFKRLADGRVRMTMSVSGTKDVLLWLLGHTGTFEVLQPPALREEVRVHAAACYKAHGRRGRQVRNN